MAQYRPESPRRNFPVRRATLVAIVSLAGFLFGAAAGRATEFHRVLGDTLRETDPTPSPDGKWLAYTKSLKGPWTNIWIRPIDGQGPERQLTQEPDSSRAMTPTWSPDGKTILFVSTREKYYGIYAIPFEGGEAKKLSAGPGSSRFGAYSPDGKTICFPSNRLAPSELYGYNLFLMDAGGETDAHPARQLTDMSGSPGHPTWSPDGKWIAFVSKAIDTTKTIEIGPGMTTKQSSLFSMYRLFKIAAEGGKPIQLSGTKPSEEKDEDVWPTWSPDGSWIATAKRVNGKNDVWLVDPNGKRPAVQVTRLGNASKPTWAPDGKSLWFSTYEKGHEDVWVATDLTIPPPPSPKAPAFHTVPAKDGATGSSGATPKKTVPKSGTTKK